jgi:hypothetical protein
MTKHSGIFRQSDVGQAIADNNWVGIVPLNFEYLIVAGGGGSSVGGGGAGGFTRWFLRYNCWYHTLGYCWQWWCWIRKCY